MTTSDTSCTVLEDLNRDRRHVHRHPEEGWTEFETTWFIVDRLRSLGFNPTVGIANIDTDHVLGRDSQKVERAVARAKAAGVPQAFIDELGGYTGAVLNIDTGRPGPVTACRFDIDCVCVDESCEADHIPTKEGFASEYAGLMHACGHDGHTAVGLAVAKWLAAHKDELCGTIRLIFQPAEEGTRGAYAMTAKGIVDDVDHFIAGHVGAGADLGEVRTIGSRMLATSKINIDFTGVPSHAGANPEKGRSALLAATTATSMIQGISRHSGGDSRVSIGVLRAGEGRNVTPVHAHMELETRGVTGEVNEYLEESVRRMAKSAADAYGVEVKVTLAGKAETVPCCPDFIAKAQAIAAGIPGVEHVFEHDGPCGSEDCSFFMNRVVKHGGDALFFLYGSNNNGHHRSDFDLQPEALVVGFEMYTRLITDLNKREG